MRFKNIKFIPVSALAFYLSLLICSPSATPPQKSETLKIKSPSEINTNISPKQTGLEISDKTTKTKIWSGKSAGFNIIWTENDIFVRSDKGNTKSIFSNYAKRLYEKNHKSRIEDFEKDYGGEREPDGCIKMYAEIASIVGSTITLEVEETFPCGVIQYYRHWIVFDLNQPQKIKFRRKYYQGKEIESEASSLKLTDFFSDEEILEALLDKQEIRKAVEESDNNFAPHSSKELLTWFEKNYKYMSLFKKDEGELNGKVLTGFVFDRIENDKIVVKVQLESTSKRIDVPFLELFLNIPEKLRKQLDFANDKKEGFLGKDRLEVTKDQDSAGISFTKN